MIESSASWKVFLYAIVKRAEKMTTTASEPNVTELLIEWQRGDRQALERLTPLV